MYVIDVFFLFILCGHKDWLLLLIFLKTFDLMGTCFLKLWQHCVGPALCQFKKTQIKAAMGTFESMN